MVTRQKQHLNTKKIGQLRENTPVYWFSHSGSTGGMWLVTGYDDVAALLKGTRTTKSLQRGLPALQLALLHINHTLREGYLNAFPV
jgi:cytochrome P450